jgi:hypothetical protein
LVAFFTPETRGASQRSRGSHPRNKKPGALSRPGRWRSFGEYVRFSLHESTKKYLGANTAVTVGAGFGTALRSANSPKTCAREQDKHLFIQKDFAARGNRTRAAGLSLGEKLPQEKKMRILAVMFGTAAVLAVAAPVAADPATGRLQLAQAQDSGSQSGSSTGARQQGSSGSQQGSSGLSQQGSAAARRAPPCEAARRRRSAAAPARAKASARAGAAAKARPAKAMPARALPPAAPAKPAVGPAAALRAAAAAVGAAAGMDRRPTGHSSALIRSQRFARRSSRRAKRIFARHETFSAYHQALLLPHPLAAPLLVLVRGGRGECDNLLDGKRRAVHEISN